MFLTQIEIDPGRRLARKYLGSAQVMHAVVMRAATGDGAGTGDADRGGVDGEGAQDPGAGRAQRAAASGSAPATGGAGRVLWRVDEGSFGTLLYVLSPQEPVTRRLEQEVAVPGTQARSVDYEPFLARLADGQVWAFRLAANPQRSVPQGPGVRGRRYGHVTASQQRQWLVERAARNGFSLLASDVGGGEDEAGGERDGGDAGDGGASSPSVLVVRRERPVFSRRRDEGQGRDRVRINRTVYEGRLRVTDAALLRHVLVSGLGASKAYGCGLLTLARPRG